jgi:hypothetical protein
MNGNFITTELQLNFRIAKGRATQKDKAQKIKNERSALVITHTFYPQNPNF